jgi:hypothetical protein
MDYVSIVELAEKAGVSGNTVILYLSMFEDFFSRHRVIDGKKKYPAQKAELIKTIHQLYQRQRYTKQEIREKLLEEFPETLDLKTSPDPTKYLGEVLEKLTGELRIFNQKGLPNLVRTAGRLAESLAGLSRPGAAAQNGLSMLDILLTTKPDDPPGNPSLGEVIDRSGGEKGIPEEDGTTNPAGHATGEAWEPGDLEFDIRLDDPPDTVEGTPPEPSGTTTGKSREQEVIEIILSLGASGMGPGDIAEALGEHGITVAWERRS